MLQRTTTLLAMFLATAAVHAQEKEEEGEKSNGVRLGYHMSDLVGEEDFDTRNGYYLGYYRNFIKVPIFSLSAGLEVNSAGATQDDSELRLTYVALPINGRIKLGPFYGDLGVDLALNVGEKWVVDGDEVDIPDGQEAESFDALGHVGVGFKFLFMGIEARYRYAITEAYDGYKNTGLQLGLVGFF
ncbi:MAG TPA: outer membrane beta-barrel protein [Flavobacteriales bacterium]|nr:outer membrane beta-barrel protein [Flavobacteriales bacterium]